MFDINENFLVKTTVSGDIIKLQASVDEMLKYTQWPAPPRYASELKTISINLKRTSNTPIENKWQGISGRIYDLLSQEQLVSQRDFSIWNEEVPEYIKKLVKELENVYEFRSGRVRLSNLRPQQCLRTHADVEQRFHLAITTNQDVFFYNNTYAEKNPQYASVDQLDNFSGVGYHVPADGFFYKSNTLHPHTAINSGRTDRIHLVVDIIPPDQL